MARINLLPWREELRRERQRQYMLSALMTAVLGVVLVFLIVLVFDRKISHQQFRNQTLQGEINLLTARIDRIEELEQTRARLLSRKRIIEELQASRALTVEMLDQMAKSVPVGVTLNTVRQQAMNVTFAGFSQSNARVSAYLQSLDQNELFLAPDLGVVKTAARPQSTVEPYEFTIKAQLRPRVRDAEQDGYDSDAGYDEMEDGGAG
jgi:type IV pilus assembly protein PilN